MKCKYLGDNGICTYYSDVEVTEPCIEGPCEHDTTRTASPRFTAEEREAMKAVLRLAQEQMYRAEATNVKGNSPNNLRWSEIYKEYLSHMNTVRKMLEGSV